jgi:dihydrodipicolinate synthase/N-acetylneuraminate lyase
MNVVPRSARQLMHAVELADLTLARRIYFEQILPVVNVLARKYNPTGTIKAGVCARGINVGVPRRPGQSSSRPPIKPASRAWWPASPAPRPSRKGASGRAAGGAA